MFAFKTALASTLLASSALAHFTLDYPTSRGFDDANEPNFCGGFTSVETRQPFPLGQGPVWIDSHHTLATVDAFISTSSNPQSFSDFNTTSNGTSIPLATSYFQVGQGEYCWNINLGALGVGLTNGSLVTLQIQYDGGDGYLYQCADLILLSNYTVPSNDTCSSDAAASFQATHTGSVSEPSATSGSASSTSKAASASSSAASASASAKSSAGMTREISYGLAALSAGAVGLAVLLL